MSGSRDSFYWLPFPTCVWATLSCFSGCLMIFVENWTFKIILDGNSSQISPHLRISCCCLFSDFLGLSLKSVFFVMCGQWSVCVLGYVLDAFAGSLYLYFAFISCLLKASRSARDDRLGPSQVCCGHVAASYMGMAFEVPRNVSCFPFPSISF